LTAGTGSANDMRYSGITVEGVISENEIRYLTILRDDISKNIVFYQSKSYFDSLEDSLIDLQKQLSSRINITCCQSCKYGNFCIFGNKENEIFCLIDFPPPKDKMDLAEIFSIVSRAYHSFNGGMAKFILL